MTIQQDAATLYTLAQELLRAEEETVRPVSLEDWQAQRTRRHVLQSHVRQCEQTVTTLRQRLDALPTLARPEHVHWAQALLAFSNLAFLEVDTDGLHTDADILRIALVDTAGAPLYDQLFQPRRPLTARIAHLTGITSEQLSQAPTLVEAWPQVVQALSGHYVLSFNLEFDEGKLAESAGRYSLPVLPLVGVCLMLRAQEYYRTSYYPKLADLCERLGASLPAQPQQDALDRARGQLHLLRMMARGITHVPTAAPQLPDEVEPRDQGDPFLPDFPDEDE